MIKNSFEYGLYLYFGCNSVVEDGALPVDPAFRYYLLSDPVNKWRLIVYEQDWLTMEVEHVKEILVSSVCMDSTS